MGGASFARCAEMLKGRLNMSATDTKSLCTLEGLDALATDVRWYLVRLDKMGGAHDKMYAVSDDLG